MSVDSKVRRKSKGQVKMGFFSKLRLKRKMKKERVGQVVKVLEGHADSINCMALTWDESILVTGSEDGTARVWSMALAMTNEEEPENGDTVVAFDVDEEKDGNDSGVEEGNEEEEGKEVEGEEKEKAEDDQELDKEKSEEEEEKEKSEDDEEGDKEKSEDTEVENLDEKTDEEDKVKDENEEKDEEKEEGEEGKEEDGGENEDGNKESEENIEGEEEVELKEAVEEIAEDGIEEIKLAETSSIAPSEVNTVDSGMMVDEDQPPTVNFQLKVFLVTPTCT